MKSRTLSKTIKNVEDQQDNNQARQKSPVIKRSGISKVYSELAEKGHSDFYSYLEWLGLAKKTDMLILTSSHHYYFEVEDLKNVKAVLNLNQLNSIKKIKEFLKAVYCVLPHKCYFIGIFTDSSTQNGLLTSKKSLHQIDSTGYISETEDGPWSSFLNMLYGIIDSRTDRKLSKKTVQFMLEDTGLKILDITEFNGLTYFCAQKNKPSVE